MDKIRSFEPSWMPKRPQSDPICIAIGVYYPFGLFEGHFELFSASSGAVGNFSQWRSCFWQICVCHFGCLKMTFFGLRSKFAPAEHYQWGLFWIFLAKELEETRGLRRASHFFQKIPLIWTNFTTKTNENVPFWYFWPGFLPFFIGTGILLWIQ